MYLRPPETEDDWSAVAQGWVHFIIFYSPLNSWKAVLFCSFCEDWNFPNCLGAVDGKQVQVYKPPGSEYFCYKKFHSINILVICDSRYCFLMVDIGFKGRNSEGRIWESSGFNDFIENGTHDTVCANIYQASF